MARTSSVLRQKTLSRSADPTMVSNSIPDPSGLVRRLNLRPLHEGVAREGGGQTIRSRVPSDTGQEPGPPRQIRGYVLSDRAKGR